MSRPIVPGDPSSLSRLATDTLAAARELQRLTAALERLLSDEADAGDEIGPHRAGRTQRALTERTRSLVSATRALSAQLEGAGRVLQEHAAEVADARHAFLRLHEEGVAMGLLLEHGRWVLPWGITGEADSLRSQQGERDRHQLQQSLDALARTAGRRRTRLVDDIDAARAHLATLRETLAR